MLYASLFSCQHVTIEFTLYFRHNGPTVNGDVQVAKLVDALP